MKTIMIRNDSGSQLVLNGLGGQRIEIGEEINLTDSVPFYMICCCPQVNSLVSSGDLSISDGTSYLTITDALKYIELATMKDIT